MQLRWRVSSAAHQLSGDLQRARIEALKRNRSVHVARTGATQYVIQYLGARTLPDGVVFEPTSADTVRFAAFGPALTGATVFTVSLGTYQREVEVNAAGYPSVR